MGMNSTNLAHTFFHTV